MFLSICENSNALSAILFIKEIINVISIVVPIILIIMLSIELMKIVMGDADKSVSKVVKSITTKAIAAVCVFFVPTLINLLLSLLNNTSLSENLCWINADSSIIENYRLIEEAERKNEEEKLKQEKAKTEEERKRIADMGEQLRKENEESAASKGKGGWGDCKGSYKGTKYTLSNTEIVQLARMVKGEYGADIDGMKAVASHMANLYEIRKHNGYTHGQSLFSYITTCGWYATQRIIYNSRYDDAKAQQAVRDVLVDGNRTLPLYIDEFDWFPGDIRGASSASDADSYKPGVTKLYNVYGASGTYFCITKTSGDANIFFYTSTAEKYKKDMGL